MVDHDARDCAGLWRRAGGFLSWRQASPRRATTTSRNRRAAIPTGSRFGVFGFPALPWPALPAREMGYRRRKSWKDSPASRQYGYGLRGPRWGSFMRNPNSEAVAEGVHTLFHFGVMGTWTDERLVAQFLSGREGNEAAFRVLLRRHGPMVLGICRRTLGDSHLAEDAFQATFLVLVKKARTIRDSRPAGQLAVRRGAAGRQEGQGPGGTPPGRRATRRRTGGRDERSPGPGRTAVGDRRGDPPAAGAVPGAPGPVLPGGPHASRGRPAARLPGGDHREPAVPGPRAAAYRGLSRRGLAHRLGGAGRGVRAVGRLGGAGAT